jgi:hypothetical protein
MGSRPHRWGIGFKGLHFQGSTHTGSGGGKGGEQTHQTLMDGLQATQVGGGSACVAYCSVCRSVQHVLLSVRHITVCLFAEEPMYALSKL